MCALSLLLLSALLGTTAAQDPIILLSSTTSPSPTPTRPLSAFASGYNTPPLTFPPTITLTGTEQPPSDGVSYVIESPTPDEYETPVTETSSPRTAGVQVPSTGSVAATGPSAVSMIPSASGQASGAGSRSAAAGAWAAAVVLGVLGVQLLVSSRV